MLIGTLDREIFSDVILPKYGSIENRYLVFESVSAHMRLSHLVGSFELYMINDILSLILSTETH